MPMITPDYCRMMARYNAWQNRCVSQAMETLPEAELTRDRGAFFGSILATCNHLIWGDRMWMARFTDAVARPAQSPREALTAHPTAADWYAERYRLDGQITLWADGLHTVDVTGPMTWHSGAAKADLTRPIGMLIVHMFNHQTHHRGQIHAMLTAAGARTQDSDLFLMPGAGD